MGKKQHQKDKLWVTCTEWSQMYGGKKAAGETRNFSRLPFSHCSISLQPFNVPYCTKQGVVFDLEYLMPFLKKFGVNPVTGEKMSPKELIKLNFHKNADGKYHCPVTFKVFNANTHIVAIKPTGNVYAFESVDKLNVKANNMTDLLTCTPFTRQDIITIQDPSNLDKFNIQSFYHVLHNMKHEDEKRTSTVRSVNFETRETLAALETEYKPCKWLGKPVQSQPKRDQYNTAHYSTGTVSASLTSTVMEPTTEIQPAVLEDDVVRYARIKKKGYARLVTNFGPINVELHCDVLPKTCENFIRHCKEGYYDDSIFHRLIRHFILQGGDPTGTGFGGDSVWGGPFKDEFHSFLQHDGRGILAMANSGPNTNKSQFYITFRSCKHLNNKHTVFGKVVGGLETLDKVEIIETDKNDKPIEEVRLVTCQVFVDPFEEVDAELAADRAANAQKAADSAAAGDTTNGVGTGGDPNPIPRPGNRREEEAEERRRKGVNIRPQLVQGHGDSAANRCGVGKFLQLEDTTSAVQATKRSHKQPDAEAGAFEESEMAKKKKKKEIRSSLSDFSAW